MTIFVKTYESLGEVPKSEAFYSRAITVAKTREDDVRQESSVGFYAETAEAATAKAYAWIDAERARQALIQKNMAAGAVKRRNAA